MPTSRDPKSNLSLRITPNLPIQVAIKAYLLKISSRAATATDSSLLPQGRSNGGDESRTDMARVWYPNECVILSGGESMTRDQQVGWGASSSSSSSLASMSTSSSSSSSDGLPYLIVSVILLHAG
ncbi:hypothetical protein Tco_0364727 [Tanacetum coccineum]